MRRWALTAAVCVLAAGGVARAFEIGIDAAAIDRAIALGRSQDWAARQRFHDSYTIRLGDPLLDRLEVLTEFRRVVIATEERAQGGDVAWGTRQANALLVPYRGTVSLVLHVTFPPQNTYRAMPAFQILLYPRAVTTATAIAPREVRLAPRYIAGQPAPPGTPILAGIVEAVFAANELDRQGTYLAGIFEEGRELRRVEVEFGRIE